MLPAYLKRPWKLLLLLAGAVAVFAAVSTIFCVLAYLGVMDRFGA